MTHKAQLVNFKSGWISSKNLVGVVFGPVLKSFTENGIHEMWTRRYQKFEYKNSLYQVEMMVNIKNGNKTHYNHYSIGNNKKGLSWSQLKTCFVLWSYGLGLAFLISAFEIGWFVNISKYFLWMK